MQEARAASALNHPNIVTLYDIASDSDIDFLVMEYVEGQSLHNRISPRGLPAQEALAYATQIVDALAAAHAAGIVHRDIKPANVMVTEKGVVKVLDFGLAKLAEADEPASPDSPTEVTRTQRGVIARHGRIHVSGTGIRQASGRTGGYLRRRCRFVRDADGPARIRPRNGPGDARSGNVRGAGRRSARSSRRPLRNWFESWNGVSAKTRIAGFRPWPI